MTDESNSVFDVEREQIRLTEFVKDLLGKARNMGADACEVGASVSSGLSVSVRKQEVETLEFNRDQGVGITVYFGKKKGMASTSDRGVRAVEDTLKAACDIARYATEDPYSGLAEAHLMANTFPELDLYYPWELSVEKAIEMAAACESSGLSYSDKITNTEGGSVSTSKGCHVYGNSHGFIGSSIGSRHGISAVLIAGKDETMQRDYWYTAARDPNDMESVHKVGENAAKRVIDRLEPRKINTGRIPVVFAPEVASGIVSGLLSAISGRNLYKQSSFLLEHLGKQIFPSWVRIYEEPLIKKAIGSASFDADGLPTCGKNFVKAGVLENYLLSYYSAKKLGMSSTANAGGAHNVFIEANMKDQKEILQRMGTGLLVMELMGHGVNIVTGDYSRGAAGYWVDQGEIQYPVSEVTIAGNLKEMFMQLVAVGGDIDRRGNIMSGSLLIDGMTVAGK